MPHFKVRISLDNTFAVEADSEDEAREKAHKVLLEDWWCDTDSREITERTFKKHQKEHGDDGDAFTIKYGGGK